SHPAQGPQQNDHDCDVIEGKQTHPERMACVEEILRAADQMMAEHGLPAGVERPGNPDEQGADGLARDQQAAIDPEADAGEDYGYVAQMQKVNRPPTEPVR